MVKCLGDFRYGLKFGNLKAYCGQVPMFAGVDRGRRVY